MGLFGIGTHNNARIAQGLDYENFRSLAFDATDNVRSGGEIGGRAVRLTKNGMGIATTRSDGSSGARAGQVSGAREAFLAAVERKFGINARLTASRMMDTEGAGKPLTSRVIKAIDEKINPFTHSLKPTQFVASQRAVFDRALQDASASLAHLDGNAPAGLDPAKVEQKVVEMFGNETFPMTSQGLVRAVAQAVADMVAEAQGADAQKTAEFRSTAVTGTAKSASATPLPKIRSQAEFVSFFRTLSATAQYGSVQEDDTAQDADGNEKKTFVFKGFVFRSDDRGPGHKTMKQGFTSRNDLAVPENKTEAMGLGVKVDGKGAGWGATGQSGISTAKTVDGAIGYLNPGGTFYIIDTTKLPAGQKAWDLESNLYENGYKERPKTKAKNDDFVRPGFDRPEEVPLDETNGEVNVSAIPKSAIVGWVTFKGRNVVDVGGSNHSRLESMQARIDWDKDYTIKFTPAYKA